MLEDYRDLAILIHMERQKSSRIPDWKFTTNGINSCCVRAYIGVGLRAYYFCFEFNIQPLTAHGNTLTTSLNKITMPPLQ